MSISAEALFSPMGDVITKRKNKISPKMTSMEAILKRFGIIQDERISDEYSNIKEDVNLNQKLSEESKSAETYFGLQLTNFEDHDEVVDNSTAIHVFEVRFRKAFDFSSFF